MSPSREVTIFHTKPTPIRTNTTVSNHMPSLSVQCRMGPVTVCAVRVSTAIFPLDQSSTSHSCLFFSRNGEESPFRYPMQLSLSLLGICRSLCSSIYPVSHVVRTLVGDHALISLISPCALILPIRNVLGVLRCDPNIAFFIIVAVLEPHLPVL